MNLLTQQKFLEACERGDLFQVQQMVENGVSPLLSDSLGLRVASSRNHVEVVRYLLPYSDPKAYYSEALNSAITNQNKDIIDALWDVSDIFAEDEFYLSVFGSATVCGMWDKVLSAASSHFEKIDMKTWAYSFLMHQPQNKRDPRFEQVMSCICKHISNAQSIEALSESISSQYVSNWRFFDRLLEQVDDPNGEILAAANETKCEATVRSLFGHPRYKEYIPQISATELTLSLPSLIKNNDLLNVLRILPHTTESFNNYIAEAVQCPVPEIFEVILNTKQPREPSDPFSCSWVLARCVNWNTCEGMLDKNEEKVLRIFERFTELNVDPLIVELAGTPHEGMIEEFLHRSHENDVLNWAKEMSVSKLNDVQVFFAKRQNKKMHENISDKHVNSSPKRI